MSPSQLAFDRDHLWHPYTSLVDPLPVYPVASAEGYRLRLADGRELVDGMSSWWSAIHGYNVPELNAALQAQSRKMSHVMFGGLTHEPAVALGQRLVDITPDGLDRVFLADSGSVSVEVAMKMAVQYQHALGHRNRTTFLTVRGGYHGDTTGPMSVCDPVTGMHQLFAGFMPRHEFYDRPPGGYAAALDPDYVAGLETFFQRHADRSCAFIVEPVVQGAGGMHFYSPAYLEVFRALCDRHGLLLIYDEIATGFGRTGTLFVGGDAGAGEGQSRHRPDIMTVGKALTGGYLTLAATLCTARVAETIGRSEASVLMHGPTFMGNPLACAVAVASIDLLLSSGWREDIARIAAGLERHLRPAARKESVKDVRVLGGIGVVECRDPVDVARIQAQFVAEGVWVRPFGRLVYVMPPYVISDAALELLCRTVVKYV
ncbi:adenosylmethionine-8-amino-7-oxononanoate aminotransferase [Lewinella marina]|uniref:Adenosylmethionine-8-amino-7-oxononanoate aminotransferase n=1 Tax=Neolewinella marina TaxID=438751 RepID=A0A2G0CF25_9BACT|nr:adenosylmethionine--8-amino-7-oxononanoate transaminase [Neolewinella marina]NJB85761.1 adenosylmethionine-8-amino-7-oxononanoate aminotransferase [Neolewinella marina]PHK98565.1 adenosylmethionine--8-amino-7-oxononanoate transaminase [Neolewinella marina]